MKVLLLLGLLLAAIAPAMPTAAAPTRTEKAGPDRLSKTRRHLRHQAKLRMRQNRHR